MVTVQAAALVPKNGSISPSARFDLVGLEAAIEAAVCRAWRQETAGQKEGGTYVDSGNPQLAKPAETSAQQASRATERPAVTLDVSTTRDLCQEALAGVLAAVEEKATADYEAVLGASKAVAGEMSVLQERIAFVQSRLAEAALEAQNRDEADQAALSEATARAKAALAPYLAAGVVSSEEVEMHLEGALREAGQRLSALRQEARVRLDSLRAEMDALRARQADLQFHRSALEAQQAQLRALPCVVTLEQARREEEARKAEAAWEAIHFLETAPWHELSWQRQLTSKMEEAVALAGKDQAVFDALVERLEEELNQVDAAKPGLGWSVVRAIEALELGRLFPTLEVKRAELVQAARRHNRDRQVHPAMADKVVSLASRWGARVVAR